MERAKGEMEICEHFSLSRAAINEEKPWRYDNYLPLDLKELFSNYGVMGVRLTARARDLRHTPVRIQGYVGPSLVRRSDVFVLTNATVHSCPFCGGGAIPYESVLVRLESESPLAKPHERIEVAGELDLTHPASTLSASSPACIVNAHWRRAPQFRVTE